MPLATHSAVPALADGFAVMGGLIVAIGAQNALLLRIAARGRHLVAALAFCTLADAALIAAGVFGAAAVAGAPLLLEAMRYGGGVWLLVYAWRSARASWVAGRGLAADAPGGPSSIGDTLRATLAAVAAVTLLNPHVYLDSVLLVGALGSRHIGGDRVAFALGAAGASLAWFVTLGTIGRLTARWLARPSVWRVIDAAVALIMAVLAVRLLVAPVAVPVV